MLGFRRPFHPFEHAGSKEAPLETPSAALGSDCQIVQLSAVAHEIKLSFEWLYDAG